MNQNEPITFDTLCQTLDDVTVVKDGTEAYARCPWCGKPPHDDKGKLARHFHFGLFNGKEFGKCFPCGESGRYHSIYRRATGEHVDYPEQRQNQAPQRKEPEVTPLWKGHAVELLNQYHNHPHRLRLWNTYKPVTITTIIKYKLGVGILPYTLMHRPTGCKYEVVPRGDRNLVRSEKTGVERHLSDSEVQTLYTQCTGSHRPAPQHRERLIVPTYGDDGEIVCFHGRSMDPNEKRYKWMPAYPGGRNPIWGLHTVQPNDTVVLCENRIDAAMVSQMDGNYHGVALSTARTIRADEIERLKAKRPGMVLVMLDNDLAGQASGDTRQRLIAEYEQEHGREAPTPLYGYKCVEALRAANVFAVLWDWSRYDAPDKAGVDWAIEQQVTKETV